MHHPRVDLANTNDNVGLDLKGVDKQYMPRSGDVVVYKKDTTLGQTKESNVHFQVLDFPNKIKYGYSPIDFVRSSRSACRTPNIGGKMGEEIGGKKIEGPHSLKPNDMAECSFQPQQPLVCNSSCDTAGYKRDRYDEDPNDIKDMLIKVGLEKEMAWRQGMDVVADGGPTHVVTLYDGLNDFCRVPSRPVGAPMCKPTSGIYKIKGVGDVLAGRGEQGRVKPGQEVALLPTHTASNHCTGEAFTGKMHHPRVDLASTNDNVGLDLTGVDKQYMPRPGEVVVYKKDTSHRPTKEFKAQF